MTALPTLFVSHGSPMHALHAGRAGLRATVEWYRANEAWWRPAKAATEAKYAQAGH